MEPVNPYASPRTSSRVSSGEPAWASWRFFVYSLFFYPVWFFVGGAFSIDGTEESMLIDMGLLLSILAGSAITFWYGVSRTRRRRRRRA